MTMATNITLTKLVFVVVLLLGFVDITSAALLHLTHQSSFGEMIGLLDDNVTFMGESRSGVRFLGIPFAKPPIGDKRFRRPEPETVPSSTYNATYFRNVCPQIRPNNRYLGNLVTSEDCLYLNVFLPGNTVSSSNNYSVMVWIYGGGFQEGLANPYFPDVLSSFNDVVVVTFNYRVNVFGFLDDGTGEFANNGLHDQKLAIDWVHDHIQSFGGDPGRVTLFGASAGSVAVMYQAFNPENRGKIHRIIQESGSLFARWAYQANPSSMMKLFAAKLNCTRNTTSEIIECFRNKPADDLINNLDMSVDFRPTFDGLFLRSTSLSLFTNVNQLSSESVSAFSQLDVLTGFNDKDGAFIVVAAWGFQLMAQGIILANGVPRGVFESTFVTSNVNDEIGQGSILAQTQAMVHEYVDWYDPDNTTKIRDAMVDVTSDANFIIPTIRTAITHANISAGTSTYLYQFSRQNGLYPPAWLKGADHTREFEYVFGFTPEILTASGFTLEEQSAISQADKELSRALMKYWTNFAKTGNPNSDETLALGYPSWPEFTGQTQSYIDLNTDLGPSSILRRPVASRAHYWTQVVPALNSSCTRQSCEICVTSSSVMLAVHRHGLVLVLLLQMLAIPL